MIIRRVRVQGFGCFADEMEIGPLADGVNVLYAPNGTGKTTLARALSMALVDGYRVRSAEIQALRPWGRGLSPRLVVEFEHRKREYRVEKRFLDGASCVLFRKEGGAWRSFMEDDDADEFLRSDVLNCTPPGSGIAKAKHWGLAQVLWTTQGNLEMPELAENVVQSIQQSVGMALTKGGSKVESKIEDLYGEFYTAGRGTLKTGRKAAPLHALQRAYDEFADEQREAEADLSLWEDMSAQILDLRGRLELLRVSQEMLTVDRLRTSQQADEYRALMNARTQMSERKRACEAQYSDLKNRIEAINRGRDEIREIDGKRLGLQGKLPALEAEKTTAMGAFQGAESTLQQVREAEREAAGAVGVGQLAREYIEARRQVGELEARQSQILAADLKIADLDGEVATIKAPSDEDMRLIRQAIDLEKDSNRLLERSRVTVEIEPAIANQLTVIDGENPGAILLVPGQAVTLHGVPNVVFDLPQLGFVRITGPATDYAAIREDLRQAQSTLAKFKAAFGTYDTEELDGMRERRSSLEREWNSWVQHRNGLLAGSSVTQLATQQRLALERIKQIETDQTTWCDQLPDPAALAAGAATLAESESKRRAEAELAWTERHSALMKAEAALASARTEITSLDVHLASMRTELNIRLNDGRTDEQRAAALDAATIAFDAARIALDQTEIKLKAFPADPVERLSLLDNQLAGVGGRIESVASELLRTETRVADLADRSPYDRVGRTREQLAVAGTQLERERRRMEAIRLLYNVMTETKKELLQAVAVPVEKTASGFLSEICQTPIADIYLNPSFGTDRVVPAALAGSREGVKIDRMSGGEKEQIYLCTRLAVAAELARQERQLLVLDDVLTFTDDARLGRICDILARVSSDLQILILTCHPERFMALRNAKLFDLQGLLTSPAESLVGV